MVDPSQLDQSWSEFVFEFKCSYEIFTICVKNKKTIYMYRFARWDSLNVVNFNL